MLLFYSQVEDALKTFPIPVDKERLPGIYQLAPTTKASMGNTPYLIVRPRKKGNIMIDVPRYGGVEWGRLQHYATYWNVSTAKHCVLVYSGSIVFSVV